MSRSTASPNPGPALGGLAFDPPRKSLFVADRGTGMIHRFDLNGAERGRYDHGAQGRRPPACRRCRSIRRTSRHHQSRNSTPTTRRPGAMRRRRGAFSASRVHAGRLYYAVAEGLQIWSVAIAPDGAFGTDARLEIRVPPGQGATEISKITFDDQGRMLLAERAAPTGAYDFEALAQEGVGRVLRYRRRRPAPGGAGMAAGARRIRDRLPAQMRNGNGGVAIGYGYDPAGEIDRNSCGGFLWSTGEQLRSSGGSRARGAAWAKAARRGQRPAGQGVELVRAPPTRRRS